jgi:protein-S-isoprenylcysteine O-methyltransferase Ste14
MTIYSWIIAALWLALIAYWVLSARGAKRTIAGGRVWWKEIGLRLVLLILVLLAVRISHPGDLLRSARPYLLNTRIVPGIVGVLFCAFGIAFAIRARAYLGANWGLPMSRKERPELVTNGPYKLVRHPIYAGILLAMFGSAIAHSVVWVLPLILGGIYFIHSARREEMLMVEEFPKAYPAYRQRTKMLVPFVV